MNDPIADWESLYREFAPRGLRFAYALLHSHADAEETVQNAFCRLWAARVWTKPRFESNGFGPVFFQTVRNLSIDLVRKHQRHRRVSSEDIHQLVDVPADDGASSENTAAIRRLVDQLPSDWKDALLLRIDGQLSYQEISEVLGCSHAQVRTWIYRARRQLAGELCRAGLITDAGATHESMP